MLIKKNKPRKEVILSNSTLVCSTVAQRVIAYLWEPKEFILKNISIEYKERNDFLEKDRENFLTAIVTTTSFRESKKEPPLHTITLSFLIAKDRKTGCWNFATGVVEVEIDKKFLIYIEEVDGDISFYLKIEGEKITPQDNQDKSFLDIIKKGL